MKLEPKCSHFLRPGGISSRAGHPFHAAGTSRPSVAGGVPAAIVTCGISSTALRLFLTGLAPAAPAFRTITVTECVPEQYTTKRTAYKWECRNEVYEACKTECVAEVRERVCNVVKRVPVMKTEARKVCKNVNVCEERTVMKTCYKTVQETCMKKELVRLGHWEIGRAHV